MVNDELRLMFWLEQKLSEGKFSEIDEYLSNAKPDSMTGIDIITVLTITYPAKDYLPFRVLFVKAAEVKLKSIYGEQRAEALLKDRR